MLFPLAYHEVKRLSDREPHEDYWKISSRSGRKCAALNLVKDVVLLPFKLPVYACLNLVLICKKIGQVVASVFSSIRSPERRDLVKSHAIALADDFFLFFLVPIFRVARIAKFLIGATIYPGICFVRQEEEIISLDSLSSARTEENEDVES